MYITDVKVNDAHFEFDQVHILQVISLSETKHFVIIWFSLPDNTHIKVNNGRKSVILN